MALDRPGWVAPMLASPGEAGPLALEPPGRWRYERKLDGLRCIAVREGAAVALWSRNRLPMTDRFPGVVAALGAIAAPAFTLDGEVVAFDEGGGTSFSLLQSSARPVAVYCGFDLLSLLGRDTTGLPLTERRSLLGMLIGEPAPALRPVADTSGDPVALLADACRDGWEGLVAKRADAPYQPGRSRDWRKLKCRLDQELVVGGSTEPTGTRSGFGALLVGWWEGPDLRYAGKVGTGFDEATLRRLSALLRPLERPTTPFSDAPRLRGAHWCAPELVVAVRFTEWTPDGRLRHPSYTGLRQDKDPRDVHRD